MIKKIVNIFILLCLSLPLYAQGFKVETVAPRVVAVGEGFRVEFKMNDKPDGFNAPDFSGFDVIAGPSTSQNSSMTIINGKRTNSSNYIISYVITSQKEGNTKIGAATATIDGKKYSSSEVLIEVVNEGGGASSNQQANRTQAAQSSTSKINKDDVLLVMSLNKTTVFKGEPIIATIKLYYRINIAGLDNPKYSAFTGFWTQELPLKSELETSQEKYNDKIYEVAKIREFLIYPQQGGEITIDPTSFTVIGRISVQRASGDDVFDAFFGGGRAGYQDVRMSISTKPVKVTVKPYPTPIPSSFNGAVGEFTIAGSLSSDVISANSASNLIVKLNGQGNLPLISEPTITLPDSFELYKVKSEDAVNVTSSGVSGGKTFTYPFIARAKGDYTIKAGDFTYFNPQSARFVTLNIGNFPIKVDADATGGSSSGGQDKIISGLSKEELKILGKDINYIAVSAPHLVSRNSFFILSGGYWITILILCMIAIVAFWLIDRHIKASKDRVKVKSKKATRIAMNRLKEAKSFMDGNDSGKFYDATMRAMWGYVGDKLNISAAQLSRENVSDKLSSKGVEPSDTEQFIAVLSACEEARYSPLSGNRMNEVYEKAKQSITQLEDKI